MLQVVGPWQVDEIRSDFPDVENPEWSACIRVLLNCGANSFASLVDPQPGQTVIQTALMTIEALRQRFPSAPPTCIVPEPAGGLIMERRELSRDHDCICEFAFYNDGRIERTDFVDGRVVNMTVSAG